VEILDNWQEFYRRNRDPEPLRRFVSEDPILVKTYNFTFLPFIFTDLKAYPFNEKLQKLEKFKPEEISKLQDLVITDSDHHDFLDHLKEAFYATERTLKWYKTLREQGHPNALEETRAAFRKVISIDTTVKYKDDSGRMITKRYIGRHFPFFMLCFINQDAEIYYPSMGPIPSDDQLSLDTYTVLSFQKYGSVVKETCFSSDTPNRVFFYHRGDMLTDPFVFQTAQRYDPLLDRVAKIADQKREETTRLDEYASAFIKLREKCNSYAGGKGVNPSGYFNDYFKKRFLRERKPELLVTQGKFSSFDEMSIDEKENIGRPRSRQALPGEEQEITAGLLHKEAMERCVALFPDPLEANIMRIILAGVGLFKDGKANQSGLARHYEIQHGVSVSYRTIARRLKKIAQTLEGCPDLLEDIPALKKII